MLGEIIQGQSMRKIEKDTLLNTGYFQNRVFDPLAQGLMLIEQWRINCKRTWSLTSQLLGIYTLGPLAIRIVMYWG